jgi:hypothetical protein
MRAALRILDVLLSTITNGEIRLRVGDKASNTGLSDNESMWSPDGFIGRPNAPDSRGACQVVAITDGQERRIVGCRDNRFADKVGTLAEGDRAIVTDGECRIMVKRADESVTMFTAAQSDGASMMVTMNGADDTIQVVHGGGSYIEVKRDSIVLSAGGASLSLNADGTIQLLGTYIGLNAPGGNLGIVGPQGEIPPAAPMASIVCGPSGMAGAPALHWTVSPV